MTFFIVNPAAGSGKTMQIIPFIKKYMNDIGEQYEMLFTKKLLHARELAEYAVKNAAERIVAVGGDGTVQEILSVLVGVKIPIGIIPAGSGNDLFCSLSRGKKLCGSLKDKTIQALKIIMDNKMNYFPIDVVKVDDDYFINIGSVGIDAEIVDYAKGLKKWFGGLSYIVSTIRNAITYNSENMRIIIDGKEISGYITLVAVCNGGFYGGGFHICPSAEMNDGYITLCHISYLPKWKVFCLFPAVLIGKHIKFKEVTFINCKSVTISYDGEQFVNLDGNLSIRKSVLSFSIEPNALLFYC